MDQIINEEDYGSFDFKAFAKMQDNSVKLEDVAKYFGIGTENQDHQKEASYMSEKEKNDFYCLLLDPESLMYYRKVIGRDDFIRLESIEKQDQNTFYDNLSEFESNRSHSSFEKS